MASGKILRKRYTIGNKLDSGSYGKVYTLKDEKDSNNK